MTGLKVIDGTPTAISKYLREKKMNKYKLPLKKTKCCWSECNNEAKCSIGNNLNKGVLNMCYECFDKYEEHCNARENLKEIKK